MLTAPGYVNDIVSVMPSDKWEDYQKYNAMIHNLAANYQVEAESIELFLFESKVLISMKYQPMFIDRDYAVAKIKWHNPVLLKDNWAEFSNPEKYNHEQIYFYKFVAIRKSKNGDKCELLYIGYSGRDIKKRLKDKDHVEKQLKIKLENQNYRLYVCAGEIINFENPQLKTTEKDLETLLIYSHTK